MSVEFSCIFGMSSGAPELEPGEQFMRINDGWTLVVIPSINDVVFWFIVRKLDRRCGYADAPRYTKEDAIAACEQYADVPVWKGIRFGDIWEKRTTFNMTALQESVFQTWSHGRVVCVGDSIHKVGPGRPLILSVTSKSLTLRAWLDDRQSRSRRQLCD